MLDSPEVTPSARRLPGLPDGDVPELLNLRQCAEAFPQYTERYYRRCVVERRIAAYKPRGRYGRTLVKRDDVAAYLQSGRLDPIGAA